MTTRGVEFRDFANSDALAAQISDLYVTWNNFRARWLEDTKETRNFIFATDTRTTTNNKLPWKNSVHIPKLCQIRDNLYANYMAALFPNDKAIAWEGDDESSDTKEKKEAIQAYMANKMRMSNFVNELEKCVLDYIDYGNCFAYVTYVNEETEINGDKIKGYVGPKVVRISPLDIVFDPTVIEFKNAPKIIRSVMTLSELKNKIDETPDSEYLEEIFKKSMELRNKFQQSAPPDVKKNSYYQVDGFTSYTNYMQSQYVELLDFYGDIYDYESGKFHKNKVITVVDRAYIIRDIEQPSWLGSPPIFHAGWRVRPDNLYAMGPLDNLVGMQYRINHLENAKADAYDMIMHPVLKIKGMVEDFDYKPGAKIYASEEGDVDFMHPDATVLSADTQIEMYEMKMELMAGTPREAAGFRTPGEKTAFEVQKLDQAANKVFINKTSHLEEIFIEPIMNAFLEEGRRNLGPSETIKIEDEDFNYSEFVKVTRDDLTAIGTVRPIGARRFARNANMLQNLIQFSASPLGQDPSIMVHWSGKKIAKLVEEFLNLENYNLVEDNIRIMEGAETQKFQSAAQQLMMEEGQTPQATPPGATPGMQGSAPKAPESTVISQ